MTSTGRRLVLGQVLGKGGEATIYYAEGDPSAAIKIYTDGNQMARRAKIDAMVADRLHERTPFVAFPVESVSTNGAFSGFTMRRAIDVRPMHQLCSPGDRKAEFPNANFRFLVRVALNFARAVASVNKLGAVIGDINESGALVDQKGLVTLVDSDSFQYRSGPHLFRCRVGKAEYTPPELQGRSLETVERTINHDAFGTAVIIFEILFMGRHPFSGIFKGMGDQPTISKAIQEGRFAYSQQRSLTQMEPPPHVPVLADIPTDVAKLFERAFGPSAKTQLRPTPAEWISCLEGMEKGIIECKANSAHFYSRSAPTCPWCRFEAGYGSVLFVAHFSGAPSTFNLDQILSKIRGIQAPGPAPELSSLLGIGDVGPSAAAKELRLKVWTRKVAGLAAAAIAAMAMVNGHGWGFFVLIPAGFLFFGEASGKSALSQQRTQAANAWKHAVETWDRTAGPRRFLDRQNALVQTAANYRALPMAEQQMLQGLEKKKRELQLQRHLEAHKLSKANVDSIGDGRKMTLRSFGIESAWDINVRSVRAVPGFGPALTENLMAWRRSVEKRFSFNPSIPTPASEIAKVRNEIAVRRSAMQAELIKGVRDLETIRAESAAARRGAGQYEAAYKMYRQSEMDASIAGLK